MNEPGAVSTWLSAHVNSLSLWIGAICTLGLYSVLYKENKVFRVFEHMFLGLATGYLIATQWNDVLLPKWWTPFRHGGEWWGAFELAAGLLFYCIYSKKFNWMARALIGLLLGVGAGQQFQAFVNDTWPQISTSFRPVIPHAAIAAAGGHSGVAAVKGADALNNLIFMFILLCVMSYFFFSFDQKHSALKQSARLGRFLMMFTFGAIFGSTIMARLALLIDRMFFLMYDFGPQVGGESIGPIVMFLIVMGLTCLVLYLNKTRKDDVEEDGEGA